MAIYADKNREGRLTGRYRVEIQCKGQRARGTAETLDQAKAMELAFRQSITSQQPTVKTVHRSKDNRWAPMTLGRLMDLSLPTLWRGTTTEPQSQSRLLHTVGMLGHNTHANLTPDLLDALVAAMIDEGKSPATVNRHLSALHKMLEWGHKRKHVQEVPEFPWETEAEGRIRWITEQEEQGLYDTLGDPGCVDTVAVAIATGMRRNEILKLPMKDVEPRWVRLWETKNKEPRSVPITEETYDRLRRLVAGGTMPSIEGLRYHWNRSREALGLQGDPLFVFHACRHTCATRLVRANVNIRVIQRWLGHKRIETTLRYAHVNDQMLTDALAAYSTPQELQPHVVTLDMAATPSPGTIRTGTQG